MEIQELEKLTKQELIEKIIELKNMETTTGKYGLVWDKEKEPERIVVECDKYLPILTEETSKNIDNQSNKNHILIEGDNFHALTVLNYTHKENIDIIYIDPPYNRGNDDFIYNDKYIDKEDGYKHSKWLNFMEKRLNLAKELLKDTGLIFISIDDIEYANLKLLCDKVFEPHNFVNSIVVKMSEPSGVKMQHTQKRLPKLKEYVLIYKKNSISLKPLKVPKEVWDDEYKTVITDITEEEISYLKEVMNNEQRTQLDLEKCNKILEKAKYCSLAEMYVQEGITTKEKQIEFNYNNAYRIFQTVSMGSGTTQLINQKREELCKNIFFAYETKKKKMYIIKGDYDLTKRKPRIQVLFADDYLTYNPCDLWLDIKTTGLDNEGFVKFKNGKKPLKLIKRILELSNNKNATVLDFFAGSGTTGQAVLEQNKIDGGSRNFILCTNNENNICEEITYKRLETSMQGTENYKGHRNNLKYYKTEFVQNTNNKDQLYFDLTEKCIPMLCIKTSTFREIEITNEYRIYSNEDRTKYCCIYFDIFGSKYNEFVEKMEQIEGKKKLYIFSLGDTVDEEPLVNVKDYKIEAIPHKIVELYRRLAKLSKQE